MSEDFFGDLGRSITRATKKAATRTGSLIETTKINAQITGEIKGMEALVAEIGSLIVHRLENGQMNEDEGLAPLMEGIRAHKEAVRTYRLELAAIRGMEVCPSCGELVEQGALFCPHCGCAMTDSAPEAEPEEDTPEENAPEETAAEESAQEAPDPEEAAAEEEAVSEDEEDAPAEDEAEEVAE